MRYILNECPAACTMKLSVDRSNGVMMSYGLVAMDVDMLKYIHGRQAHTHTHTSATPTKLTKHYTDRHTGHNVSQLKQFR